MIAGVAVNPYGADLSWRFLQQHWKTFVDRYRGSRELSYLIEPMSVSADEARAKEIEAFFKSHPTPGTERTQQQVLERIRSNAAWLARDRDAIESFLRS